MATESNLEAWQAGVVDLPEPQTSGGVSLTEALAHRRSLREFASRPLTCAELSQMTWAAQGVNDSEAHRTSPSAGALYPIEILVVAGQVERLVAGVYRYQAAGHRLIPMIKGDQRAQLASVCKAQDWIAEAPATLVISSVTSRTRAKYGPRAERYVLMEAGHTAQNCYLQAAALGLGTVMVGAFDDAQVKQALDLEEDEWPLCLLPVGRARD